MAYNSEFHALSGVYGLLRAAAAGSPGHGPIHLLVSNAPSVGFTWMPDACVWQRPGLPALRQLSSPFQFFQDVYGGCLESGQFLDFGGFFKALNSFPSAGRR